MFRKTRSDCTVGSFEKKHGLPFGTFRNANGRKTRKDKLIGTIRAEAKKKRACFRSVICNCGCGSSKCFIVHFRIDRGRYPWRSVESADANCLKMRDTALAAGMKWRPHMMMQEDAARQYGRGPYIDVRNVVHPFLLSRGNALLVAMSFVM